MKKHRFKMRSSGQPEEIIANQLMREAYDRFGITKVDRDTCSVTVNNHFVTIKTDDAAGLDYWLTMARRNLVVEEFEL